MLAATAGDAHGFRVVLSLSLPLFFWLGTRAGHAVVFFIDHVRHVTGTNHSTPVKRELAYFFR